MARREDEPQSTAEPKLPIDPDLFRDDVSGGLREVGRRRRAQRTILAVIACAGVIGALARYAMSRLISVPAGHFPWSTFWVNVSGSFVIGLVLILLAERFPRARVARPLVATGFLGAYTTFSTYMVDADLLFRAHEIVTGMLYALSSMVAGIAAAATGVVLARFLLRLEHRLNEQLS